MKKRRSSKAYCKTVRMLGTRHFRKTIRVSDSIYNQSLNELQEERVKTVMRVDISNAEFRVSMASFNCEDEEANISAVEMTMEWKGLKTSRMF
eukprot:c16322_g1_i1 orf=161-439(+)